MSMRVIAGSAKGRQLKLVPGDSTRPIMDRAKESLFNIIGQNILDAVFLDLYAGTGSVGIEALSRGAKSALFIDLEPRAIRTIQENLKITKLTERAVVRRADALELITQSPPAAFDFVYIAPPQYKELWLRTLQGLDSNILWSMKHVIVQIDPTEAQPVALKRLVEVDQRRYGNTLLWFFEVKVDEQTGTV